MRSMLGTYPAIFGRSHTDAGDTVTQNAPKYSTENIDKLNDYIGQAKQSKNSKAGDGGRRNALTSAFLPTGPMVPLAHVGLVLPWYTKSALTSARLVGITVSLTTATGTSGRAHHPTFRKYLQSGCCHGDTSYAQLTAGRHYKTAVNLFL